MTAVELNEFKKIIQECEDLRYRNVELKKQIHDLNAELNRFNLLRLQGKVGENN